MSKILVNQSSLSGIAEAIRQKNGTSTTYKPSEMGQAILDIPTGGSAVIESKNITVNGTYAAPTGVDGYSPVVVAVQPNLQSKTTTENGTVTPDSGYDGLSSVVVNVSGGGGDDPFAGLNDYIQSSGTQSINTGYVLTLNSEVELIVNLLGSSGEYSVICGTEDGTITGCYDVFDRYKGGFNYPTTGIMVAAGNGGTQSLSVQYSPSIPGYINVNSYFFNEKIQIKGKINENFMVYSHLGKVLSTPLSGFVGCAYPLWLFDVNTSGSHNPYLSYCVAKLYACRFYESGTLTMELLPAHDTNNVVCLYDTVSGNYFYNQGTGDFVFGTDS